MTWAEIDTQIAELRRAGHRIPPAPRRPGESRVYRDKRTGFITAASSDAPLEIRLRAAANRKRRTDRDTHVALVAVKTAAAVHDATARVDAANERLKRINLN